ncbi:MAG: sulfopyruvate decarboxylase subunit alpha [Euryarchaeota archaeon]|nr:sulfopyruvate decarboxylase subunit alpha [Euryarchaeota archaeon]MBV1729636.1 sulfopyruvate decarboxylase subunit alpha [Methanobacterium sp.]MBU4548255.1 sulfopyruvate decarboxylase subunit alpha [Euryarchaeota archaeon]MBU4608891.1 sulfopyruvate decarboxylase subunit alpha [Euryarchaeota archaeon]MBV1755498.1 sulfopyruvate decarboxylase subunit alpha [Methanobacterium sp.]
MNSNQAVYQGMVDAGIDFVVSLPCVNLGEVMKMVECNPQIVHIPVTREEEGLGICAGAFLAGKNPAILMQNSGLGNCVNALASLFELYHLPLLLVMSHRGTLGEKINGQIPMGRATPKILDALNIPYSRPKYPEEALETIVESWEHSMTGGFPVGVLLDNQYW